MVCVPGCTGDKPLLRPEESCSAEEHDIVDLTDTPLVTDNSRSSTDESDHSNTLSVQKRKRLKGPTKILEGVEYVMLDGRKWGVYGVIFPGVWRI